MRATLTTSNHRVLHAALDLIQAGGMLLILSLVSWGLALTLPPLLATPLLVAASAYLLLHLSRREWVYDSLQFDLPPPASLPWIVFASGIAALFAPLLALLNHRVMGARSENPDIASRLLDAEGGWVAFALLSVAIGPLAEETILRGWLLGRLRHGFGPASALAVTSLFFALMHGTTWRVPYYFLLGLLLGGAVLVTRSVWTGVALHVSYNASLLLLALRFPTRDSLARWLELHLGPSVIEVSLGACVLTFGILGMKLSRLCRRGTPSALTPLRMARPGLVERSHGH